MPTLLGTKWPPTFDGRPTRISPEDREIWRRYWPTIQEGTLALYFDVGVGAGRPIPEDATENEAFMWLRNNQKRIDIIAERQNEVWMIELRFAAQSSAIGRLLTYRLLWSKDDPIQKPVKLYLVTNSLDTEIKEAAEISNITYLVV